MGKHNVQTKRRKKRKSRKFHLPGKIASLPRPEVVELIDVTKAPMWLSPGDKLICSYKRDKSRNIREITTVAYCILVGEDWETVVYYDSVHGGILHRHVTVSMENKSNIPTTEGVKKTGSQNQLLAWANKDLRKNYLAYRSGFLKRSREYLKKNGIDIS